MKARIKFPKSHKALQFLLDKARIEGEVFATNAFRHSQREQEKQPQIQISQATTETMKAVAELANANSKLTYAASRMLDSLAGKKPGEFRS